MTEPAWRRSRWKRAQAAAIAAIGTPLVEALGATYNWRESGADHLREVARQGRQPILALWHGRILTATLYFRDRGVVAMTSENFDGEWVARLMNRFGYHAARGSTSRGGAKALAQLRREMASGYPTAFTVDGPRGPARVAQPGAAWLASASGHPIVPFHIEADRFWTVRSWDSHQVPKPGATLGVAIGPPIDVPGDADDAAIEIGREAVESALADLEEEALALVRK
ncbi:MAG TPA: lysophospholipid acyltransferase family protein [Vicinamibacterales bacterium]|nr:lysophospholipid acyltransferase family protein [Vicinamibacterales bacterium]